MISFRPFRNTDPPGLAEIWRSQPPHRRRAQGLNVLSLERFVFSKPYFDREGLIVALEDDYLVGYVHAGFGPTDDGGTLSSKVGVVSALLSTPKADDSVMDELLSRAECYLIANGASRILAGGVGRWCPFYLGLYGGSQLVGVLDADPAKEHFLAAGYDIQGRTDILQRSLIGYRPAVDRALMQIRRSYHIEATLDPAAENWWDACTTADADRTAFCLETRDHREQRGRVVFTEMEAISNSWGVRAVGLTSMNEVRDGDDINLSLFLLGEAMRQLQGQGVSLVEAQTHVGVNEAANDVPIAVLQRLGFEAVDQGITMWKELP